MSIEIVLALDLKLHKTLHRLEDHNIWSLWYMIYKRSWSVYA